MALAVAEENRVQNQFDDINRKLDAIAAEMEQQRRYRLALEDLKDDLTLVLKAAFPDLLRAAAEMERKGYLRVAGQMGSIADAMVSSHSSEDLEQARDSIPQLIGFLRQLTRPAVLEALEVIVNGFGEVQSSAQADVSLRTLIGEMNSPEARRGWGILIRFLKVIGARNARE
jgi:uncharacterized protein YjgD (DUF1641 family)